MDFVSLLRDGATPDDLVVEFGLSPAYAAVVLSRLKRKGILLKRGNRYHLSQKGELKLAYYRMMEAKGRK